MLISNPTLKKKIKNRKSYYFVCCGNINGNLVADTYFLCDRTAAYDEFYQKHGIYPSFLDGPFYRKIEKNRKEVNRQSVKLTGKIIDVSYKDKKIKAMLLSDPENYVLLIGNVKNNIVHISEIKKL